MLIDSLVRVVVSLDGESLDVQGEIRLWSNWGGMDGVRVQAVLQEASSNISIADDPPFSRLILVTTFS